MKKIVFVLLGFSSLMVLSCRQQEEIMDSEDLKSLSVLQEAKDKVSTYKKGIREVTDTIKVIKDADAYSAPSQVLEIDSHSPPR